MRAKLTAFLVTSLCLAAASRAHAQQLPDGEVAAAPRAPTPATADPNIDRGFILPTAMTQPAGSVTYNNYELLLHGVTYGITDNVQATVTVLSPVVQDMPLIGFGAVKGRFAVNDRFHLALQGSLGFGHSFTASSDSNVFSLGAGGYASFCLREDCSSLFNGSVNYQYGMNGNGSGGSSVVIYGGSIVHRAASHLKLLAEITSAAGRDASGNLDNISGFLASYGVRFYGDSFAADIGFVKPVDTSGGNDLNGTFIMGLPFVSVSYRWD